MIYLYDGSFDGFLTTVFDTYKVVDKIWGIEVKDEQTTFFENILEVKTRKDKARRVENALCKHFGQGFFYDFTCVFLSDAPKKEIIAARALREMYRKGPSYLDGVDYYAVNFRQIAQNVKREVHTYKGILRFDQVEGKILIGKFSPKNNILSLLYPHFKKRMPYEKFIIADVKRNQALVYCEGKAQYFYYEDNGESNFNKDRYPQLWQAFYDHIAIEERKNRKLQQNNLPKKYRSHMTEFS